MINIKDYQEFAKKKWKPGVDLATLGLGLGGESGEVLDILKKARRDQKPVDMKHIKEELGDVFWYAFNLCSILGFNVEDVLEDNVKKLNERYKEEDITNA